MTDDTLTTRVTVRVTPAMLARWTAAAAATGRTVPELIRQGAESEVEYSRQAAALRERLNERRAK